MNKIAAVLLLAFACSVAHGQPPGGDALPQASPAPASVGEVIEEPHSWIGQAWGRVHHSPQCIYGSKEFLLWWMKGADLVPLVTHGSTTDPGVAGSLGQPSTRVLIGNEPGGTGLNDGGRINLGYWLNPEQTLALESNFFFLGQQTSTFTASSASLQGTQVLARPFFDQLTQTPSAQEIAGPGLAGSATVVQVRRLLGAEANLRVAGWSGSRFRVDFLGGFRFLALDDDLNVDTSSTDTTGLAAVSRSTVQDAFATRNRFYGGQVGAIAQYYFGRWTLQGVGKLALGGTDQVVHINGFTSVTDPAGMTSTVNTGLLAQSTNIGRYTRGELAFVPEVGVNVKFRVTSWLRLLVGYTFLYDTNVVRPGNQVDTTAHAPTLSGPLPAGQTHPSFSFHGTDFWAQGISVGCELRH